MREFAISNGIANPGLEFEQFQRLRARQPQQASRRLGSSLAHVVPQCGEVRCRAGQA
jgi:hypothetical protein